MPDYPRIYARQEYLTPGAPETVAMLPEAARLDAGSRLLDVACGKGEAACSVAAQTGCRVMGVDRFVPFLAYTARKIADRGLADRVSLLRADGRRLPLPDSTFDAASCIGGPSIVGTEACLRELRRAVRPGGVVAVSDLAWRPAGAGPLGPEWGWIAAIEPRPSADDYAALIRACGLTVERVHIHPLADWEAYHAPMERAAAEERARGEHAFADESDANTALERRAAGAVFDYATFIARRP